MRIKKKTAFTIALFFCIGLWLMAYFNHVVNNPPATPPVKTFLAPIPARAEMRSAAEVRTVLQTDHNSVGPLEIVVRMNEFQALAATSNYKALVTYNVLDNGDSDVAFEYWLSRGDGFWYKSESKLSGVYWGWGFDNQWLRLDNRTWVAKPVWNPVGAGLLVFFGIVDSVLTGMILIYNLMFWLKKTLQSASDNRHSASL